MMNGGTMHKMSIYGINFDLISNQPIVLLKSSDENRFLPIWIGHFEAGSIMMKLQNAEMPRPLTHDLTNIIIDNLGATIDRVTVTDIKDGTFYAIISLNIGGKEVDIDSRPSDAIALAVRADAPIYATDKIIDEATVVLDSDVEVEDEIQKFRDFIESVSPDDFGAQA